MIQKWKKKPLEVEAVQYVGDFDELRNFVKDTDIKLGISSFTFNEPLVLQRVGVILPNGQELDLFFGDFLVKGIDGSIYPVSRETFLKSYEPVKYELIEEEKSNKDIDVITW